MARTKMLIGAGLCGIAVLLAIASGTSSCILPFLGIGAIFCSIAWLLSPHDPKPIMAQDPSIQIQTWEENSKKIGEGHMMLPPMTNKGSQRLFVPPPPQGRR